MRCNMSESRILTALPGIRDEAQHNEGQAPNVYKGIYEYTKTYTNEPGDNNTRIKFSMFVLSRNYQDGILSTCF